MVRIAVAGAAGRMGRAIIKTCQGNPEVSIVAALECAGSDVIGVDAGQIAGVGSLDVHIVDTLDMADFDVLIDFTNPSATLEHVETCLAHRRSIVIGTTGLDDADRTRVREAASSISVVMAPNMSVGVNLCLRLLQIAARTVGNDSDIEIVEAHHRYKVDAPSGTALRMGEVIANAMGVDLARHAIYERFGVTGPRPDKAIGFATIRAGEIVGEHTALFAMPGERLEITHRAASRETFARGAMHAAVWVTTQGSGLYDMQDVLGLR